MVRGRACDATSAIATGLLAAGVAMGLVVGGSPAAAARAAQSPAAQAPGTQSSGRVVLVGDSILLGAKPQLEAAFTHNGLSPVVDAQESRSTLAGADVVASHLSQPADALVVMLGANDGGNPSSYRERVRAVMAAAAGVPRLYWVTVPEVRSYYPAANAVVRDEVASRPGAKVIDWQPVTAADPSLTHADGLHLTSRGADAMAFTVAGTVLADLRAAALPPATVPPATVPPATVPPATVPVATAPVTTAPPTVAPATTVPPTTVPPTTVARTPDPPTSDAATGRASVRGADSVVEAASDDPLTWWAATLWAAAVVCGALVLFGGAVASWALWRSRGSTRKVTQT